MDDDNRRTGLAQDLRSYSSSSIIDCVFSRMGSMDAPSSAMALELKRTRLKAKRRYLMLFMVVMFLKVIILIGYARKLMVPGGA